MARHVRVLYTLVERAFIVFCLFAERRNVTCLLTLSFFPLNWFKSVLIVCISEFAAEWVHQNVMLRSVLKFAFPTVYHQSSNPKIIPNLPNKFGILSKTKRRNTHRSDYYRTVRCAFHYVSHHASWQTLTHCVLHLVAD